ncbi:nitroreductase family protein [Marinigracilibium pacificum]|uniref:Putative NAD(P)H nitroreductase n=1 Tax=Marinigracilibium pacificum TaxID=2729599 RepID=A0A848IYG6_9BACT|nr:nitroreductase [Marinigracilibium pacificum]NMM47029.1 nitroreductase [Marinigracilibium pacificum]
MPDNSNQILTLREIIQNRRAVYPVAFNDAPVDDHIIEEMLEAANWAPTHRLTQPWRFSVFTGEGINKLADFQSELYKKIASEKNTFKDATYDKLKTKPLKCSHIISIGMKRDIKQSVPEIEEVSAVACAVQNMWLTASAHKVGCYWGSGGITYEKEALPFFGLSDNDQLLGFLYIGNTDKPWPKGRRSPITEKTEWIRE